ncbi:MAG TPA: hypothetical protein VF066_10560 [Thermoleophilaceae bacterium]
MKRLIRAMKLAARDPRIPRPVRAVAAFGLLPIPGPLDEGVLLLVAPVLWLFYRRELREAWANAAPPASAAGG